MQYRPLGMTGLTVSELGFGCGAVGGLMTKGRPDEQRTAIARALEAGVTYFDTAQSYGDGRSEENLGRALSDLGAWERVVVGTKLQLRPADFANARGRAAELVQVSLRRLSRDHLDIIQQHGRIVEASDGEAPTAAEATEIVADALDSLRDAGLVRNIGFTGLGDPAALHTVVASGRFNTVQSYFNAVNPSAGYPGASNGAVDFDGLINRAAGLGMGVINIRALAAGALSGSTDRATYASSIGGPPMTRGGEFETDVQRTAALQGIARDLGIETTTELGFRFCLAKSGVSTVLVGFSDLNQLEQAVAWTERGSLDEDTVERIVEAARAGQS
jgi:aryl-alcohol dehydrogenase-like predicted oxidoreductase